MNTTSTNVAVSRIRIGRLMTPLKAAVLIVALDATAYGGLITLFSEDFEGYGIGTNPNSPPIGEPWQISEVAPDGVDIAVDLLDPNNHVLMFGCYRNTATVPFSAVDRQRIALAQNLTVSFDYYGRSANGYSNYFDIGAYDSATGDPAFLIRIPPQENALGSGSHDVHYLDPAGELVDSGVDVKTDKVQSVTITADFAKESYELDIEGKSVTLPLFLCPSDVHDVQFSNYGIAMGSGSMDHLAVTVTESQAGGQVDVPELATIVFLAVFGFILVCVLAARRTAKMARNGKAEADRTK